jgi:bifunctional DNA-binding transcriptional regulator/antitoxin component of YhaV-PrlF toxin-antitoxin module
MLQYMSTRHRYFATLQARGLLALPAELRRRYRLDEPGSHVEIIERDDGVIELRPRFSVPAEQAWFWTDRWQRMEHEVDEHVERGETTVHADGDELVDFLDDLRSQG